MFEKEYSMGYLDKCAEYGVDPISLLKYAQVATSLNEELKNGKLPGKVVEDYGNTRQDAVSPVYSNSSNIVSHTPSYSENDMIGKSKSSQRAYNDYIAKFIKMLKNRH